MHSGNYMKSYLSVGAALLVASLPLTASAVTPPGNFRELVELLLGIIDLLVYLVIGLSLIVFMWGLISGWILNPGELEGRERGKKTALWGVVVFTVMVGVWGILSLLRSFLFGA